MTMAEREFRGRVGAIAIAAALAISVGCAGAGLGGAGGEPSGTLAGAGSPSRVAPLRGRVIFDSPAFSTRASIPVDVAPGSPVSLVDPGTGFTLASALTDPNGGFLLTFSDGFVPSNQPYILEAAKGLKDSVGPNAPGASVARVRTFVRSMGGTWKGLTRGDLTISTATTALAAGAGLKGLKDTATVKPVSALFDTLEQGTADGTVVVDGTTIDVNSRFTPTGDLSVAEYKRLYGLIARILADDADPVASLFRDPGGATVEAQFQRSAASTAMLGFAQAKGSRGQTVNLVGRNLSADAEVWFASYQGSVDSNLVKVPVAATVGALSADRRTLQVTIPSKAASGEVVYRRGYETFRVSTLYGIVNTVATVVGTGQTGFNGDGLPGDRTNLSSPYFLTIDGRDNLVIGDLGGRIRKWDRVTGAVGTLYSGGGGPVGLDYDSKGNLYVALYASNYIKKVDPQGVVTTIAGTGVRDFSGDGGPAVNAAVGGPHGLAVDASDNIWFCDYYNGRIRKIGASSGIIETAASTGCVGSQLGPDNALYIAAGSILRLDLTTKALTTWATGTSAGQDIWVDAAGNVYVATWGPGSNRVQRVDKTTKEVTFVAGNGQDGFTGEGGDPLQAAFYRTSGVAVDKAGNLFVADYSNSRIRYVALP